MRYTSGTSWDAWHAVTAKVYIPFIDLGTVATGLVLVSFVFSNCAAAPYCVPLHMHVHG